MFINSIKTNGYKNLENIDIELKPDMNIICGENAQGKTNLIEAIWTCTGCSSFRGTRDKDIIGFDKQVAEVELEFTDSERRQAINFKIDKANLKNKSATLNGVPQKYVTALFGKLRCVVFTPDDLELVKGSPEGRRRFLDLAIAQIKRNHVGILKKYNDILADRNALLKHIAATAPYYVGRNFINVYDEMMSPYDVEVTIRRHEYCKQLNKYAGSIFEELTDGKEKIEIRYQSNLFQNIEEEKSDPAAMAMKFRIKYEEVIESEVKSGYTGYGIHRDDMCILINGMPAKEFASQGQIRSIALALKFAQAKIMQNELEDSPIMLLDDVLSELDDSRQKFVLTHTSDMQVIITCCDERSITDIVNGRIFTMQKGNIIRIKGE